MKNWNPLDVIKCSKTLIVPKYTFLISKLLYNNTDK